VREMAADEERVRKLETMASLRSQYTRRQHRASIAKPGLAPGFWRSSTIAATAACSASSTSFETDARAG